MAETITKDNLFRVAPPGPKTRADFTDSAARTIIKAEADSREAKTQRLRLARLEMEARRPEPAPTKTRRRTANKTKAFVPRRVA